MGTFFPGTIAWVLEFRRRHVHAKLAALPGVRRVRRPLRPDGREDFDLHYVRTGPRGATPLVIIPGGPGMASIAAYRGLRARAADLDLDVIMVEHRGVGMSRRRDSGADLPHESLTITAVVDDIAAVLDDAGVEKAVVYGTSYGTYLAAGVGVHNPDRVTAMVLDSPLLNRDDYEIVRRAARALLWSDDTALADKVRRLTDTGALVPEDLTMAAAVYGLGGAELLERHLDRLLDRRRTVWNGMRRIALHGARRTVPYRSEADLVGPIGFRELNFAGTPDGLPLDTTLTWSGVPGADTPFDREPFDLAADMRRFDWPTVIVSGGRDLITPAAVADRIAATVPKPALVRLPTAAHSILDTRGQAALRIAAETVAGRAAGLPDQSAELDALPAESAMRVMRAGLAVAAGLAGLLPRSATS